KIGPYADTLKGIRDPNLGYRPVLDSWMGRLFGFTKDGWVTDYSTGKKRWVEPDAGAARLHGQGDQRRRRPGGRRAAPGAGRDVGRLQGADGNPPVSGVAG